MVLTEMMMMMMLLKCESGGCGCEMVCSEECVYFTFLGL